MLKNCKLYVIIDKDIIKKRDIIGIAEEVMRGGADIIQLRDKSTCDKKLLQQAKAVRNITKRYKRLFIINDRVDIACIIDADGVHLGQGDISVKEARKILGKKIIGVSTHNTKQSKKAERIGADYIGIGPIFKSKTKKGLLPIGVTMLRRVSKITRIPFFAIGGITLKNISHIKKAGADRVAVASSALEGKSVYDSVKRLKEALTKR